MTFKDLQKVIESEAQPNQGLNNNQLQRLRNKEFWYWFERRHKEIDRITKGDCCMQHIIGLPKKGGKEMPIFEYERQLYRALVEPGYLNSHPGSPPSSTSKSDVWYPFKEKHLWIKKATGEKADAQYDKGHVDQADRACEKGGYDGYIDGDCGYLN